MRVAIRREQRHGLGVFLAHEVVSQHDGVVVLLESERGAVFAVRLPVAQPRVRTSDATASGTAARGATASRDCERHGCERRG